MENIEELDNLIEKFKLSDKEHSKVLKQLTSSLFANFKPTKEPVAYFIIGQPGVGKTTYINGQNLSHLVYINADHYRKLHTKAYEILNNYPLDYVTLTSIDANKLANEVMNYATEHNYSFLRERAPRSLSDFLDLIKTVPAHYKIVIDIFACGNINSILSTRERFEMQRNNGDTFVKLTSFDAHNQIYNALPQIVNALCDTTATLTLVWRADSKTPAFNTLAYTGNKTEFVNKFNSLREIDNQKHATKINKRVAAIKKQMLARSAPPEQFDNLKMVEEYCKKEVNKMLEIGINSNNECGKNLEEVLINIKAAGFNNVMLAMKAGNYEEQIKLALDKGLKIPYIHLNNRYSNDLWAKGESNANYVADVIYQLELCAKYKIKIAVLHPTEGGASNIALPPNKQGILSMNKILAAAQNLDVKIALENLDNLNFKNFKYLLDNISNIYLGLCYDMGHHQLYNPRFDILKKYSNKIWAVHLHDNLMDWEYGYDYTRDLHRLPFDGKLNYPALIKKLAATPYNNVVMLELHKDSCGKPRLYDSLSASEFLSEAKVRAEKLVKMIEENRK